jgi:1,5-anhydro-D-fructose reductase (1,5-anhydro-D-mannitol-forming)
MANAAVGWGLIGSTSWGDHTFGPAIGAARGARLAAVLSSRKANAAAFCAKHGARAGYTELEAFLGDPGVDAVWVAGPTDLHLPHTLAALDAGKHVLCEKPMAVSAADCAQIVKSAEKRRLALGLGYNNRHHPVFQALQRDWTKGVYGTPIHVRIHCFFPSKHTKIGWRGEAKRSGGWALGNIGTHLIDLARWFMGDVAQAFGHLSNLAWGIKVDDHAIVTMGFKNGGSATISAAMTRVASAGPRFELYGSHGHVVFDGALFGLPGTMSSSRKGRKARSRAVSAVNTYKLQVEAFDRALRGGAAFQASARDGLENLKVMEQARGW